MKIVMTGGTAGIGLVAARRLVDAGHSLIIGARRPDAAPAGLRAELRPLNLADLASAQGFAESLVGPIDVLLLNAGLQAVRGERSAQGLEITFAANHLAHLLILKQLIPRLSAGARVVITSSGTHDPALNTGMPPPRHADARKLARPETDPDRDASPGPAGRRAYSASKLCNVMTARELARRLATDRPDVSILAFDPGFTPGTGLARSYPPPLGFVFRRVLPIVVRGARVSTPTVSGRALADLATAPQWAGARGAYVAVRRQGVVETPPSALAQDEAAGRRLWAESEAILAELGFG